MNVYFIKRKRYKIGAENLGGIVGETIKNNFLIKGWIAFYRKKYAQEYIDKVYGKAKGTKEIISVTLQENHKGGER